jgi:hypothetical protein
MAAQNHRITGPNLTSEGRSNNPPTYEPTLDVSRCVALHNALVGRSVHGSETPAAEVKATTWWDRFGREVVAADTKFHPAVREFLEAAWYSWDDGSKTSANKPNPDLFWTIQGIPPLGHMFQNDVAKGYTGMDTLDASEFDNAPEEDDDTDDDETPPPESPLSKGSSLSEPAESHDLDEYRFVTLYQAVTEPSRQREALGVVYDQRQHKAIFISDKSVVLEALSPIRGWQPLEVILDLWHSMADQEKIMAVNGR